MPHSSPRPPVPGPEWHDFLPQFRYANTYARWKQRLQFLGVLSIAAMVALTVIVPPAAMPGKVRIFFITPILVLSVGMVVLQFYARRVQRRVLAGRDPPCPGCGYDVGEFTPCPECGADLDRGERKLAWREAGYRDW